MLFSLPQRPSGSDRSVGSSEGRVPWFGPGWRLWVHLHWSWGLHGPGRTDPGEGELCFWNGPEHPGKSQSGAYAQLQPCSTGLANSLCRRSQVELQVPDLFCLYEFAVLQWFPNPQLIGELEYPIINTISYVPDVFIWFYNTIII